MSLMKSQLTEAERTRMISDHVPFQYDKIMIWNIDSHTDNLPEVAMTIARKIANGEMDTFMLQEVSRQRHKDLIKLIDQNLKTLTFRSPINFRYQRKEHHGFGNLIISTKQINDKSEETVLRGIRRGVNNAEEGAEKFQIQVAIIEGKTPTAKKRILLNVHANSVQEKNKDPKLIRINVKKVYDHIQSIQNTPPYNNYEIIMAGDFNKGKRQLPEEILAKHPVDQQEVTQLTTSSGYQHPNGTSYVHNDITKGYDLREVDAVFAFNVQNNFIPLVHDNFGQSLDPRYPLYIANQNIFGTIPPAATMTPPPATPAVATTPPPATPAVATTPPPATPAVATTPPPTTPAAAATSPVATPAAAATPAVPSATPAPSWTTTSQRDTTPTPAITSSSGGVITQDIHKLDMNHMISKHAPYQFGNIMVWNIDSDKNKVNAVAETIAAKIVAGEIDTFMLQGVDVGTYWGTAEIRRSFHALIKDHVERLSAAEGKDPIRFVCTTLSPIGNEPYGNLLISTRSIATTVHASNDPDKNEAITQLKAIINKAGGQNGQVQLAIVKGDRRRKDQIILNVHASSDERVRVDLNKIYEFINKNKDEPPFDDFEIIMAGEFNADFNALPMEVLGYKRKQPKYPHIKVRELEQSCYQHGTYTSYKSDGKPMATEAVFAFNRDEQQRTEFRPLFNDNLGASLGENDALYQANVHRFSPAEEEDTSSQPQPTLISEQDLQVALGKVSDYCDEKGYAFQTDDTSNVSSFEVPLRSDGNHKIHVTPQPEKGVAFSTKLTGNSQDNEVLLDTMAEAAEKANVRQVRLVLKNADNLTEAEKKSIMDQLWLSAKNNNLEVLGYEPDEAVKQRVQPRAPAQSQEQDEESLVRHNRT